MESMTLGLCKKLQLYMQIHTDYTCQLLILYIIPSNAKMNYLGSAWKFLKEWNGMEYNGMIIREWKGMICI